MIPWNYNIYDLSTDDYMSGAEVVSIGTLLATSTYDYFNTSGKPLYSADCSKLFDNSIYLWHIGTKSAFATNAAWCVEKADTLNLQVVTNQVEKAPFGLQLCNIDSESFKRYPKGRMAYDYYSYLWFNYVNSRFFVDINRTKFCMRPRPYVYDKNLNTIVPQSVQSVANYINADSENRYIAYINMELYHGDSVPRTMDKTYIVGTALKGVVCGDILTERPIPSNATGAKTDMLYDFNDGYHATWRTDTQYSPFAQCYSGLWYSGDLQTDNNINIGFMQNRSVNNIRTGSYSPNHGDKVTGGFIKYNDTIQEFDDVSYKWTVKVYYVEGGVFLDNGYPLDTLPNNHNIRFFTALEIVDRKGLSIGAALQAAVKHECAFVGFYFTDTLDTAQNATLGTANNNVFLPELIGGTTTGRYFTGDDIPNVPYANSTTVGDSAFRYDSNVFDDDGLRPSIINTGTISCGVTYYGLTENEMKQLTVWLNTTYAPNDYEEFIVDFKGTNPADYLTTVMYYPFDIPYYDTSTPITIGKLSTGTTGAKLNYEYGKMFDYGTYHIPAFGDFRDYMTKITVFIPFCGTVELDPRLWVDTDLTVKMSIDWPTGICTAFLFRDGAMFDSISGTVGVPLPLSSFANGSYQVAITNLLASHKAAHRQMISGALSVAGGAAAGIGGAFGGNPKMMIGGLLAMAGGGVGIDSAAAKMDNIDYNIEHTQPTISQVSGGSPFINCGTDYSVIILRTLPELPYNFDMSTYSKTVGFADCRPVANLKAEKGLTVVTNINTDGLSVPLDLIAELTKACKEGLIL